MCAKVQGHWRKQTGVPVPIRTEVLYQGFILQVRTTPRYFLWHVSQRALLADVYPLCGVGNGCTFRRTLLDSFHGVGSGCKFRRSLLDSIHACTRSSAACKSTAKLQCHCAHHHALLISFNAGFQITYMCLLSIHSTLGFRSRKCACFQFLRRWVSGLAHVLPVDYVGASMCLLSIFSKLCLRSRTHASFGLFRCQLLKFLHMCFLLSLPSYRWDPAHVLSLVSIVLSLGSCACAFYCLCRPIVGITYFWSRCGRRERGSCRVQAFCGRIWWACFKEVSKWVRNSYSAWVPAILKHWGGVGRLWKGGSEFQSLP